MDRFGVVAVAAVLTLAFVAAGCDLFQKKQEELTSGATGGSQAGGSEGTSGTAGTSGTPGTTGTSGTSGTTGTSGTSGTTGTSGTSGSTGTSGTSGTTGTSGTSGDSGTSGASENGSADSGHPPTDPLQYIVENMEAPYQHLLSKNLKVGNWVEMAHGGRASIVGRDGENWIYETRGSLGENDPYLVTYVVDAEGKTQKAFAGRPGTIGKPIKIEKPPEAREATEEVENDWTSEGDYSSERIQVGGREIATTRCDIVVRNKKTGEKTEMTTWCSTEIPPVGVETPKEDGSIIGTMVRMQASGQTSDMITNWGTDAKPELKLPE